MWRSIDIPRIIAVLAIHVLTLCFCVQVQASAQVSSEAAQPSNVLPHSVLRLPNVHPGRDPVYAYAKALLYQTLKVTEAEFGTFELVITEQEALQARQLRNLEHSMLDVTWSVTTKERERHHQPIRIPIMEGLFGKRALFINSDDTRFDHPLSLAQLKTMRAVQGYDWPDTRIFRSNNIRVLETTYDASFKMVAEKFADMYPRSVMEINHEIKNDNKTANLKIAPNIVIAYPSPMFYFVSSDRPDLAERIQRGLEKLLANGELKRLLEAQEIYQQSMTLLEGREIINLENPLLSEQSKQALDTYLPYPSPSPNSQVDGMQNKQPQSSDTTP
ncbi:transporter substrate-binding domain-containing protein [Alteromonas sp. 345S023]|uniref:Transporter substrate-binding domain-containing protein n=1 Tax=Alteromonas profundi TaxID=2696062 RepID=A0A7X5LN04_9ALTE|nr:transporter substrate-binding domain-containing protein [Alteromonas profundi]NDV92316.1 transporter substrate-binding domain-containing protein [Alteromonas profundi]